MKKTITLIIVVALVAIGFYLTFTTVTMGGGMMRDDMMTGNENRQQEMEQQNMTGEMQGRYMIEGMMGMGSMMNNSAIVVTPDGGLVVLMGNQLYKYKCLRLQHPELDQLRFAPGKDLHWYCHHLRE